MQMPLFLLICAPHLPSLLPFCLLFKLPLSAMTLGFGGGTKKHTDPGLSFTVPSLKLAEAFTLCSP